MVKLLRSLTKFVILLVLITPLGCSGSAPPPPEAPPGAPTLEPAQIQRGGASKGVTEGEMPK